MYFKILYFLDVAKEWLSSFKRSKQVVWLSIAIKNLCFHHRMSLCRMHTLWVNPCISEFPKIKLKLRYEKTFYFLWHEETKLSTRYMTNLMLFIYFCSNSVYMTFCKTYNSFSSRNNSRTHDISNLNCVYESVQNLRHNPMTGVNLRIINVSCIYTTKREIV